MARYIDADLMKCVLKQTSLDIGKLNLFCRLLDETPTADVVPKSEVAREIFAEIKHSINDLEYQAKSPRKTVPIDTMTEVVNWVLHEIVPNTLAEVEKKYTEGKSNE